MTRPILEIAANALGSVRTLRSSRSRHRNHRLRGLDFDRWETDPGRVRAMVSTLSRLESRRTPTKTR